MIAGAFVLSDVIVGMIEASTTYKPPRPCTPRRESTTAAGSDPMRQRSVKRLCATGTRSPAVTVGTASGLSISCKGRVYAEDEKCGARQARGCNVAAPTENAGSHG